MSVHSSARHGSARKRDAAMASSSLGPVAQGQALAEYALILSLIAIVAVLCLLWLGNDLARVLSEIGGAL